MELIMHRLKQVSKLNINYLFEGEGGEKEGLLEELRGGSNSSRGGSEKNFF